MPSVRKTVVLTAALIGAVLIGAVLTSAPRAASVPDGGFALQDPRTGRTVKLQRGAPALHVVFFAIWCPPCRDELRELNDLAARWEEQGYRSVLVAVQSRQSADRLVRFEEENDLPGELLFDADGSLQSALKADQLPTHIVFDRSGREVERSGALDDRIQKAVESLLATSRHGGRESR